MLSEDKDMVEVLRYLEIAESTGNRWRSQYGGINTNGAKRLEQLQVEYARSKKLLAEVELDSAMSKERAEREW